MYAVARAAAEKTTRRVEFRGPSAGLARARTHNVPGLSPSRVPVRPVLSDLRVGAHDTCCEQEADRIAEWVADGAGSVAPSRLDGVGADAGAAPRSLGAALADSGRPLERALRGEMEQRFDHDFSAVRIHSGPEAERSARDLGALAYTVGTDVVLGAGALSPGSRPGRRLIAHELTHVVQQSRPGGRGVRVQRAPAQAGGSETTEFVRPNVSIALSILQRARELACNEPADLVGAYDLVAGLEEWMDEVANISRREEAFHSLGFAKETAMLTTGHSVDAVTSLRRQIALWERGSDGPDPPMHRPQWDYRIGEFEVGMEFLEVLTGERTLEQTAAPAIEEGALTTIDLLVSSMPVVGTALMIGEVIAGRDLAGHKLSGLQRAILGGVAILSELPLLIHAAGATTDAARLAALSRTEVSVLRDLSQARAAALVAGARSLTASDKDLLKRFARIVKAGGKLSAKDLVKANELLGKMNEAGMVAEALERNAAKLKGATGLVVEEGAQLRESERQVGEKLLRTGRFKQGLALKAQPDLKGVKTADFVMDGQLVDAYEPKSPEIRKVIEGIADYHRQAGIFAVDLSNTTIKSADLISQMGRLWGKPKATDISLVIVIDGERVIDVARPSNLGLGDVAAIGGPAARSAAKVGQISGSSD
jgi:hypothetical protein